MKFLPAASLALSFTAIPVCAQTVVIVQEFHPSSQNPRITVTGDGKPQPSAELKISRVDKNQKLSVRTDSRGAATLPHLALGRYCIIASTSPTLRGDLCIEITRDRRLKSSAFTMELVLQPPPLPTLKQRLEAAAKAPPEVQVRGFSGTICDPTGAVIQRATVAVYRHGVRGTAHPKKGATDQQGHFAIALIAGKYIAVIESPGFETRVLTFEISPSAAEQELKVKLNLGAMSETVAIARKGSDR